MARRKQKRLMRKSKMIETRIKNIKRKGKDCKFQVAFNGKKPVFLKKNLEKPI